MSNRLERVTAASRTFSRMKVMLDEHSPEAQEAIIANLTALVIAGYHPSMRQEVFDTLVQLAREIVPELEGKLFPHGLPASWRQ
jgi:hypothetical protein